MSFISSGSPKIVPHYSMLKVKYISHSFLYEQYKYHELEFKELTMTQNGGCKDGEGVTSKGKQRGRRGIEGKEGDRGASWGGGKRGPRENQLFSVQLKLKSCLDDHQGKYQPNMNKFVIGFLKQSDRCS